MSQTKAQLISDLVQALAFTATASAPTNGMFLSATNELAISTNSTQRLTVDSSGNVGIGTSSPTTQLTIGTQNNATIPLRLFSSSGSGTIDLVGRTTNNKNVIQFYNSDGTTQQAILDSTDSRTRLFQQLAANLTFGTDNTERLLIDSSGNVGIGTSSPAAPLDLQMDSVSGIKFDVRSGGGSEITTYQGSSNSNVRTFQVNCSTFTVETGVPQGATTSERLRIDNSGNVGIGTTSPDALLNLEATSSASLRIKNTQNNTPSVPHIELLNNNNEGLDIKVNRSGVDSRAIFVADTAISVEAGGSERLRIDSSGNVGIGTTSPASELHLENSSGNCGARVISGTSGVSFLNLGDTTDNNIGSIEYDNSVNGLKIITNNNERIRIDSSGNVGIGTTSGDSKLTVVDGPIRSKEVDGDSGFDFQENGSAALVRQRNNRAMVFYTNNAERMRITQGGNVGIGTSSPDDLLHISSGTSPTIRIEDTSTGGAVNDIMGAIEFEGNDSSTNASGIRAKIEAEVRGVGGQTDLVIYAAKESVATAYEAIRIGSTSLKFNTDNSERLRIDSSGRVGIGTTSPSRQLALYNSSAPVFQLVNNTTGTTANDGTLLYLTSSDFVIENQEAGNIRIQNNGSERMRIQSDGTTLIGTTSTTINSSNFGTRIGGSSTSNGIIATSRNVGTGSTVVHFFGQSGEFLVRGDGDCENTNNRYTGISDIKLKENVVDASSQWDDIKALQVRHYNFKEETGYSTHTQIGLVAQEVETVCPGLVGETNDTDDELNETGTVTKSVAYSVLYMKAVKALQEAMDRIETLEAKVAALEAE